MKKIMFTDVEFFRNQDVIRARFFYKQEDDEVQKVVFDPTLEWLKDFADEEKPYRIVDWHAWSVLVDWRVAQEAEPKIRAQLEEKGALTDDELSDIFKGVYAKYFPEAAQWMLFNTEYYLHYIDIYDVAEKVWRKKGE